MDLNPVTMSHLADMIIVTSFFAFVLISWGYFLCEFVSMATDKIRNNLKKRKEKKESDENRIAEH